MPWPYFSELSFGFGFLREFERRHCPGGQFSAAPDFITPHAESKKGYDAEVLVGSTPVFFQFKRSFVLETKNAKEIKLGYYSDVPIYRMHLRQKGSHMQHKTLQNVQKNGGTVFYVTSQVPNTTELSDCYIRGMLLDEATAMFTPNEISLPNDIHEHHVSFRAGDSFGYVFSEEGKKFRRKIPNWKSAVENMSGNRRNADQNRSDLFRIVEQVTQQNPDARRIAERIQDPVAKASAIAYFFLDAQLAFFKG